MAGGRSRDAPRERATLMGSNHAHDRSPAHEAADWIARLQGDSADEADWASFEAWLAASPENWAAYDKLERLSVEIGERGDEALKALRMTRPVGAYSGASKHSAWVKWAVASVVAVAAAVLAWIAIPTPVAPQMFNSAKGQVRQITLEDGTHIVLNTASHIEVALARRERRVTMGDAEASFDVAKDASRPFLITVGDRTVKVVGTEFNVANRDRRLSVTVTRGIVEIAPGEGAQGEVVRLVRGDRLVHQIGAPGQIVDVVSTPEDAFSWRKLRLVYDNASLEDVVADLNRYFPRPVVLDVEAKRLKFSGVIVVADEDAVLRRLEELLPVAANNSAHTVLLRRRTPGN
ncbi:MAG: FecR domain-containing protein [Caulobacteraceae bacterium]